MYIRISRQLQALGKSEDDGGAVDAGEFGGLLLKVVVGDVLNEGFGSEVFTQLSWHLERVEVFAEYISLKSVGENVGGGVLDAVTEEEANVALFLHSVLRRVSELVLHARCFS